MLFLFGAPILPLSTSSAASTFFVRDDCNFLGPSVISLGKVGYHYYMRASFDSEMDS